MEKDPDHSLSDEEKRIARLLVRLRRENELTLNELSERTGLSESYLSRVENLKAPVTIGKLTRLARAYVLPMRAFFEGDPQGPRCRFTPAGEGTGIRLRGRSGVNVRLLSHTVAGRRMEPFIVDVATAKKDAPMQSHDGDEFLHVLKGRCRLLHGDQGYELGRGDSIYFDATVAHRIEPVDRKPCEVLAVLTSRDFTFHGNLARLLND